MTQKELNQLYKKIDQECTDDNYEIFTFEAWQQELKKLNASTVFCEGNAYEFIDVLEKYGFTVLKDPNCEGMDGVGYVIFPPNK